MQTKIPAHVEKLTKEIEATFPQYFIVAQYAKERGIVGVKGKVSELSYAIVSFCKSHPEMGFTLLSMLQEEFLKPVSQAGGRDEPRPV